MFEEAVRSSPLRPGGTHLQYSGFGSRKERQPEKESCHLYDAATQHYRALKSAKADSFETLLTVILPLKLDEKTWLKWAEFNSDSDHVPSCT